jgi:phenylalanyl-tRNA synthetase beta chain
LNASRGQPDVTRFEVGTVVHAPAAGALLPTERERVAAVSTGTVRRAPVESDRPVDAYDAVDLVRIVADSLAVADVELRASDALGWESGASAEVVCEGISVGRVGVVDRATAESVGLSGALVGFEVDLELLSAAVRRDRSFIAPSPFPPSTIDLSFVAAEHVPAGRMVATIRHVAGDLLEDVRAFDEFRGDTVGAGRRSLTFALRFRAADRTLTDNEIAELRERCVAAVVAEHGAELRA